MGVAADTGVDTDGYLYAGGHENGYKQSETHTGRDILTTKIRIHKNLQEHGTDTDADTDTGGNETDHLNYRSNF